MSAADISVNWYANGKRATVTDEQGLKWWVAPSPNGGYYGLCDDTGDVHGGFTADVVLSSILGEHARLFPAGVS